MGDTGANSGMDICVYQPYCVDVMHLQDNISSANGRILNLTGADSPCTMSDSDGLVTQDGAYFKSLFYLFPMRVHKG